MMVTQPDLKESDPMSAQHPFYFLSAAFSYPGPENRRQIARALASLATDLGIPTNETDLADSADYIALQAEYMRLFVNAPGGVAAPPYASIFVQGSGSMCQQGHDQAMAFYRRAGVEPLAEGESEDHLRHELAFVGHLLDHDELALLQEFLDHHLCQWFPGFLLRLDAAQPCSFYRLLGHVTELCLNNIQKEVVHG